MTMLTAQELADLRLDFLELLPDSCTIERPTETTDDYGNTSASWATADTSNCRLDPFPPKDVGSDGVQAEREMSISYFRLTVQWDTDVQYGDRVVFGDEYYQIINLYGVHSLRAVKRLTVAKLQGESDAS